MISRNDRFFSGILHSPGWVGANPPPAGGGGGGGGGLTRPWPLPVTSGTVNVPGSVDSSGNTDVTAALQAVIDGSPDGRIIQFPSGLGGTYKISSYLKLAGRNNLIIDLGGNTLKNVANANGANGGDPWYVYKCSSFFWLPSDVPPNHITVINGVATHASPQPLTFQSGEQAAFLHGMGGTFIEVGNITGSGFFGDLVTVNQNGSSYWVHENHVISCSRQLFSVICGHDLIIQANTLDGSGYGAFDIEPESGSIAGCIAITIKDNITNGYGFNTWLSINGPNTNLPVTDIVVSGNRANNKGLFISSNWATANRQRRLSIIGNSSDTAVGGGSFVVAHVDGLTITGNTIPGTLANLSDIGPPEIITPNP